MESEENSRILSNFGLSNNQAKIYTTVVRMGMVSIGQISKISKVRREDVYRTLPKLEKLGLIERMLCRPIKVRALPVEEALNTLIKLRQEESHKNLSMLRIKIEEFSKVVRENRGKHEFDGEESYFALISEREPIINKIENLVKNAKKEIDFISSEQKDIQFLVLCFESMKKSANKGITLCTILEGVRSEDSIQRIRKDYSLSKNFLRLKYTYQTLSHFLVADKKQAIIGTSRDGMFAGTPCLWSNNGNLVNLLQTYFRTSWRDAAELGRARAQMFSQNPQVPYS